MLDDNDAFEAIRRYEYFPLSSLMALRTGAQTRLANRNFNLGYSLVITEQELTEIVQLVDAELSIRGIL